MSKFDLIMVFSATKASDRAKLGEKATQWLEKHTRRLEVVDKTVTQSSDHEFHCLSITLFCRRLAPSLPAKG